MTGVYMAWRARVDRLHTLVAHIVWNIEVAGTLQDRGLYLAEKRKLWRTNALGDIFASQRPLFGS